MSPSELRLLTSSRDSCSPDRILRPGVVDLEVPVVRLSIYATFPAELVERQRLKTLFVGRVCP